MIADAGEWRLDLLEEHRDELELLWALRREAWRSPEYDARALARLDERIEAHVDALLLSGDECTPALREGLASGEVASVLSSAYVLLRMNDEGASGRVMRALRAAEGEALEGLRLAARHGPIGRCLDALQVIALGAPGPRAAAAISALAFHGRLDHVERALDLLASEDEEVRRVGWEAAAMMSQSFLAEVGDPARTAELSRCFQAAMDDPSPVVRREAGRAAAWTRQGFLLSALRARCESPGPERLEELRLLAILGTPADLPLLLAAGREASLGPDRIHLLGSYGHPAGMDDVLDAMHSESPMEAAAAASAFRRMTGVDVATGPRVVLGQEEDDDDDPEASTEDAAFELRLPDAALARSHWDRVRADLSGAVRCCHGVDIARRAVDEALHMFDLESRWEISLRRCYEGISQISPADLERFNAAAP